MRLNKKRKAKRAMLILKLNTHLNQKDVMHGSSNPEKTQIVEMVFKLLKP